MKDTYKQTETKKGFRLTVGRGLILALIFTLASCDKLLDVDSQHIVNEENKWQNINDARASLMGIYGLLRSALAQDNAQWIYGDVRQGDFLASSRRDLQEAVSGNLTASYPLIENLSNWRKFFAVINAANLFIENSGKIVAVDQQYTALNQRIDVAQARALKGFCYFLMARIWGDVPIWDKAYEGTFPKVSQSPENAVLAYAEQELRAALNVLPFRYGSLTDEIYPIEFYHGSTFENWDGVLFNRISVNAILAHLMAWSGKYLESSVYSEYVLANAAKSVAGYVPIGNLTSAEGFFFTSTNSQLVAFPFKWSALEGSFDGHIEQLALAEPLVPRPIPEIYIPRDRIVSIFRETGDLRFTFNSVGIPVTSYFTDFQSERPIFSKIKVIRGGSTDGSFPMFSSAIVFSRLEDIALLRAEALAVLGEQELARGILGQLRKNRGLPEIAPSPDLLDEIFLERQRELMGEGHRWFDQVRYHKIKGDDAAFNTLITEKGIFWPVAAEVLAANPNLKQNPYWN
ncbi:RagB/SusD family nutrient uptake outer membrane protein [Sphingobacterium deserti]|uniref:RagB/SusD domain-containing protein n=1 Tax=Sphingobacterium deserti TaxID=1229276 RepID=A0A0B8T3H8_9SPHI|nr:RagB/SusD family nutrient uptake outer membrane protein [Sphingobacterium deserti]KGE15676.1 RagB/SusD domain-containing protein [Sphingobacterium deserti]